MNLVRLSALPKILNLAAVATLLFHGGAASGAGTLTPVATTGYNQDVVVENGAVVQPSAGYTGSVTATMEGNTSKNGTTFYETGLDPSAPTTGLPTNNTPFLSADLPNTTFQLQPYTQSNALLLSNGQTGTLTLNVPTSFSNLAFLVSTAYYMGGTDALTLHFADGTPNYTALSLNAPSWFDGANPAFTTQGRVDVPSASFFNVGEANPRLYDTSFDLAALGLSGHPISSVDFTFSGGGNSAVFALSGTVVPEPNTGFLVAFGAAAVSVACLRARQKRFR